MKLLKRRVQIALIRNRDRLRYSLGLLPYSVATELRKANSRIFKENDGHGIVAQYRNSAQKALSEFLMTSDTIFFPKVMAPTLSVIIVAYNQAAITFRCLQSLRMALPSDTEIILINNNSSDETGSLFLRCQNAKIISNLENVGFLEAVNLAVLDASGEYILLLNNDTLLDGVAIHKALNTIKTERNCGVVGAKLVHFNGRLQEAGGIILNSGICQARGRGENNLPSRFSTRWDADYCSGAFLLTPRKLFIELNGFNKIYGSGYYEDVDYCIKVRKHGCRVIYEPESIVYHLEYGSANSVESAIEKMENNRQHFISLHGESLKKLNYSTRRSSEKDQILIIDDHPPDIWRGCGFPRMGQLIGSIHRSNFECTLAITSPREPHPSDPKKESAYKPFHVIEIYENRELKKYIEVNRAKLRAIIACRPNNLARMVQMRHRFPQAFAGIELVYDSEAIFSDRDARARAVLGKQIIPTWSPALEFKLARKADQVWAICEKEKEVFESYGVKNVSIVSDSVESSLTTNSFTSRSGLLFVGSLHAYPIPNTDGLRWFLLEIYPRILEILKEEIPLKIVGEIRIDELFGLDKGQVEFVGAVSKLETWFNQARIFVAPVRYCAGIPRKCLDAAAFGLPIVTTDLQAGQLGWRNGKELLSGPIDSPKMFAENCATLYKSEQTWELIRSSAHRQVLEQFSIEQLDSSISKLLKTSNRDINYNTSMTLERIEG